MNILKEFRLKNKIKQVELAKESGIRAAVLSKIENNWEPLSEINIKKLVNGYSKLSVDASRIIHKFLKENKCF